MQQNIDYLAIERKDQLEGSYNAAVKELVVAIRRLQNSIPDTEIEKQMPSLYDLQKNLHRMDDMFGKPRKEYVKEIWDVLRNKPQLDDTKHFAVCGMSVNDENDKIVLTDTGNSFPQYIIAEEWIKKSAAKGRRYVILEVIEPE